MLIQPSTASDTRRAIGSGSPARKPNPLAAAILLGLATLPAAQAATIIVTTAGDAGVANTCTLRQAVLSMNNSTLSGQCQNSGGAFGTNDTINFAPAINTVTLADAPNNSLTIIAHDLTIDAGAGRNVVIERPAGASYDFSVVTSAGTIGSGQNALPVSLQLVGLTIQNGVANNGLFNMGNLVFKYDGGGGVAAFLANLTLDRCVVRNNSVDGGGGGVGIKGEQLTLRNSSVYGNTSKFGGGIASGGASILISDSTLSQNVANGPTGGGAAATFYGGIQLVNSTVSGNTASKAGAFSLVEPNNALSLLNSTLACNVSVDSDAAIRVAKGANTSLSVTSTILANTSNSRCPGSIVSTEIAVDDMQLTVTGSNNLLVSSSALDPSAPFATAPLYGDPQLGPLQNNGGLTLTHALPVGSIAINGGSNPANLAYDQRGAYSRTTGRSTDIGAFEYPYAGLCGSAHGRSFTSLNDSSPNLCAAGAVLQGSVNGSGPWGWLCAVSGDPGTNEFCGARVLPTVNVAVTNAGGTPISSAIYGQPVKLKSIVSGSASAPAGTVTFFDATQAPVPLCVDVALANSGGVMSATCDVPPNSLGVGSRLLRSSYGGNGTYGPASSSNASLAVQPATTTTAISSNAPNPSTIDSPYTVVAQITVSAPSVAMPSGTVTVEDQTDNLSCIYYVGATPAGCAITPTSAGNHALRVSFSGDPNMTTSSTTTTHNVNRANSTTTLTAPASIAFGQSASVGATVTSAIARTPTGSIQINGGSISCNFNLASASSCSLTPTTYGTFSLSAAYSGDAAFNPSSSAASILTVQSHTIGGQVSGLLAGRSLTLYVDTFPGSQALPLSANGIFAFGLIVPYGTAYAVSIVAAPPDQTCTISNGSGSMLAADITNIAVTCTDTIFKNGFDP